MNNQKGSMLVALIVMMVIIAVLGAGMVVINGTSFMTAAKSGNFNNALYLAEAGIRYGQSDSFINGTTRTLTMTDSWQQMIVTKDVMKLVTSTGLVYPGTALEARMTINNGGLAPKGPPADTRDPTGENPNNLFPFNPSTFTGGDTSVFNLDTPNIRGRVAIQAFLSAGGSGWTHAYWAALQNFTTNATPNSEQTTCNISYLFVPISQTYVDKLREAYNCYGYVSYQMATKVGWLNTLPYAAHGLNFRWSESSAGSGKYQGYALSFMIFQSQTGCSTDFIPNNIKPGSADALAGKLLLVLWKQKVVGGMETRNWLAYAVLGYPSSICRPPGCTRTPPDNDPMVTGRQDGDDGYVDDDATIGVRIEDVVQGEAHHNEIKVFYGDASSYFGATTRRTPDANATNTNRKRYNPQWIDGTYFTTWPSHNFENLSSTDNTLTYWSYCGWLSLTPYIRHPNAFDSGEIVIPTMRYASDGQAHYYIVNRADDCTCPPSICPVNTCTVDCSFSGTTEPAWPFGGNVVDDGAGSPPLRWHEEGIGRPSGRYDYFTVLSANPQGTNNAVIWNLNPAFTNATDDTKITLSSDNSTIITYENGFVLDSFPAGRQEIGMHGMANANFVPLAFDDLSLSIVGRKE